MDRKRFQGGRIVGVSPYLCEPDGYGGGGQLRGSRWWAAHHSIIHLTWVLVALDAHQVRLVRRNKNVQSQSYPCFARKLLREFVTHAQPIETCRQSPDIQSGFVLIVRTVLESKGDAV